MRRFVALAVLILRDRRPGRQGEGGLRVALTLCALPAPQTCRSAGDTYPVILLKGRGAVRGEQHRQVADVAP